MGATNSSCYEVCILAVGSVPLAPIENSNLAIAIVRKRLEETDEPVITIDLFFPRVSKLPNKKKKKKKKGRVKGTYL
jgi:hypothetical protein